MDHKALLGRIVVDPKVMVGKPVIKGTRLTVQHILRLLAEGEIAQNILDEYEGLSQEDIQACFLFATEALENDTFFPLVQENI